MPEHTTKTEISASAESVWQILIGFESYSQWSKYITNVDFKGSTAVGSKGTYTFAPSPGKSRVAPVTLTAYVAGTTPTDASVIAWGVNKGCIINAERTLSVQPNPAKEGTCIFTHHLRLGGCLSAFIPFAKAKPQMDTFGPEVKARAEGVGGVVSTSNG
mmetsp:Transcript_42045/g.97995  ORF Transcript_42045/g.97995 Transcript_42045/m.97995 type:complete len:159 (-) Transcript_42045:76-552(-)|eukprot:CAMPEP_0171997438 /NCGR_PEP_ID=MMETSP1041-20130122/692_1 /TAXON_ID=464988 /ORGANISM="Hemiselmis andersenii, Strain CCMP439" /LENGTH=158 /DNA_ID=CAMNT_0012650723 /DNA_START=64 /DNA_END=540 /DNA_ORIENTATION=-